MKWVRLRCVLLTSLLILPHWNVRAETALRVAILPFDPVPSDPSQPSSDLEVRQHGEVLSDRVFANALDVPGVEWVERGSLDELLAEAELTLHSGSEASAIQIGRLLKADLLMHGTVSAGSWTKEGEEGPPVFALPILIEVIDLTNASVLASKVLEWKGESPDRCQLDAPKIAEVAAAGRELLQTAIRTKRTNEGAFAIAPVLFANAGGSPRLDSWEGQLMNLLEKEARSFPGINVLRFPKAREAVEERKLALLGLTDADPLAWQSVAQAYIWGRYRELPAEKTTAFEDIQIEMELFLWRRTGDPQRFVRTFAVKDFRATVVPLVSDVIRSAAQEKPVAGSPESGALMAQKIHAHLCEAIGAGFFATEPEPKKLIPHPRVIDRHAALVINPIRRLPFGDQKLAYCRRMLELACFFDVENDTLNLLRFLTATEMSFRSSPDRRLTLLAECMDALKRLAQTPGHDTGLLVNGADFVFDNLISRDRLSESSKDAPFGPTAQRDKLLREFLPWITEQLPAILRRLDGEGLSTEGRAIASGWLWEVLKSDASADMKMAFLEAAWPSLGPAATSRDNLLMPALEAFMIEIGDRKRVQTILSASRHEEQPAPGARPAQAPSGGATPVNDSLFADLEPVPAPRFCVVRIDGGGLSWEREVRRLSEDRSFARNEDPEPTVFNMSGYGDQLLLDVGSFRGLWKSLRYRVSTQSFEPLEAAGLGLLCSENGRALFRRNEALAWVDLITEEQETLSFDEGLPVALPSMIGFAGDHQAVVADESTGTVGVYDWLSRRWFTPPEIPNALFSRRPGSVPKSKRIAHTTRADPIVGTGDWVLFPRWNLFFNSRVQSWSKLPLPEVGEQTGTRSAAFRPPRQALALQGDFWIRSPTGLVHFSPHENRVLWEGQTSLLEDVCADGPYLWLLLGPSIEMQDSGRSRMIHPQRLVLFDPARHEALGAMKTPERVSCIHVSGHEMWLGVMNWHPSSLPGAADLLRAERADLYAALSVPEPPATPMPARPTAMQTEGAALYEAILRADVDAVREFFEHRDVSPNATFGIDETPALVIATWTRSTALVKLFIEHGANLEASAEVNLPASDRSPPKREQSGCTAVVVAARQRDPAMVQLLLQAGAQPNDIAVEQAIRSHNAEVFEALAKAGAPLDGVTDLIVRKRDADTARRLLGLHLDLPSADRQALEILAPSGGFRPDPALGNDLVKLRGLIDLAIGQKKHADAVALVRMIPSNRIGDSESRAALRSAIRAGALPVVVAFLDGGADPDADPNALPESLPYPEIMSLLLQRGADPHLADTKNEAFIARAAVWWNAAPVLPPVLEHYQDLGRKFGYGTVGGEALSMAALAGRADAVKILLDHGVPPDALDRRGNPALKTAVRGGSARVACLLAGAGSSLEQKDLSGRMVVEALRDSGEKFLLQVRQHLPEAGMEKRGAQCLIDAIEGCPSFAELSAAVSRGDIAGTREMLARGAPMRPPCAYFREFRDKSHASPGLVYLAVKTGSFDLVKLLIGHGADPHVGKDGLSPWRAQEVPFHYGMEQPHDERFIPADHCEAPLIAAASAGDMEMITALLDAGAYAPARDELSRDAVDAAATPEIARFIEEKARVQFLAEKLHNSFKLPTGNPDFETIQQVAASTPSAFSCKNAGGRCPLTALLEYLNDRKSTILIRIRQEGVTLDALDYFGMSPLHHAVLDANLDRVRVLMKLGLDPKASDARGVSSLELAEGVLDERVREQILTALKGNH